LKESSFLLNLYGFILHIGSKNIFLLFHPIAEQVTNKPIEGLMVNSPRKWGTNMSTCVEF
jgi:hypothetical protein